MDHGEPQLPVGVCHVARLSTAQAEILNTEQHAAVYRGAGVSSKAVRVALEKTNPFCLYPPFGGVATVHRDLVPVTHVEISDLDEIVCKLTRHGVAGHILDSESVEIEELRYREAVESIEFPGLADEVFSQTELMIAFDPGNPSMRKDSAKRFEDLFSYLDLFNQRFAGSRRQVESGDFPKVLKVPI